MKSLGPLDTSQKTRSGPSKLVLTICYLLSFSQPPLWCDDHPFRYWRGKWSHVQYIHSFENCTSIMFEVQLRCILMVRCATTVEDTSQWVHYEAKLIIWCIVMAHGETSYSCGALMLWVTVWDTVNVHNCKYKCKWWVTQGTVWDPNCVIIGWDHLLCQDGQDL